MFRNEAKAWILSLAKNFLSRKKKMKKAVREEHILNLESGFEAAAKEIVTPPPTKILEAGFTLVPLVSVFVEVLQPLLNPFPFSFFSLFSNL